MKKTIKSARLLTELEVGQVVDRYKKGGAAGIDNVGSTFLHQQRAEIGIVKTPKLYTEKQLEEICEQLSMKYDKRYQSRIKRFIASDETVDSYGDIIRQKGWDMKRWKKNPVIMAFHDYNSLNIGMGINGFVENSQLYVDALFALEDDYPFAETIFKMVDRGFLKGNSVGFIPKKVYRVEDAEERAELGLGEYGVVFESQELLEDSVVPIGANPAALVQDSICNAAKNGVLSQDEIRAVIKADTPKGKLPDGLKEMFDKALEIAVNVVVNKTAAEKLTVCPECKKEFDYTKEPEAGMGFVLCPNCKQPVLQEGKEFTKIAPEEKPYPNEHACRLNDPGKYETCRRTTRDHEGKEYSVIFCKLKDSDTWEEQAYRYGKDKWTAADAEKHCKDHNGMSFEPAAESESVENATDNLEKVAYNDIMRCILSIVESVEKIAERMIEIETQLKSVHEEILDGAEPRKASPGSHKEPNGQELNSLADALFPAVDEIRKQLSNGGK